MATQRSRSRSALIVRRPGICGGSPTIEGTRIRVSDIIYSSQLHDGNVEAIREGYPHLSAEQVEAALEYYGKHRESIEREMAEEKELADEARWRQHRST
jgi:uncharacterized protein (DUF433 family)